MKVNRESGKALTLNDFIKPLLWIFMIFFAVVLYCVIIYFIPEYEIEWISRSYPDKTVDGVESFIIYPRVNTKDNSFLFLNIGSSSKIREKTKKPFEILIEWQNMESEIMSCPPFWMEGQYVVDGDSAKLVMNGYYTVDGRKVDIYKEYPLDYVPVKKSDYGPIMYAEKLKYIPEDVRQKSMAAYAKNKRDIEDLMENGTVLRRHRVFFSMIFTLIYAGVIILLLKYYRKHHPKFTVDFVANVQKPDSDFYYVLPKISYSGRYFLKFEVQPADHLLIEFSEMKRAEDWLKGYCEGFGEKLPARFEGSYLTTVIGSKYHLRGFYTEGGVRKDISEDIGFDFTVYPQNADPPEDMRPDLSWGYGKNFSKPLDI